MWFFHIFSIFYYRPPKGHLVQIRGTSFARSIDLYNTGSFLLSALLLGVKKCVMLRNIIPVKENSSLSKLREILTDKTVFKNNSVKPFLLFDCSTVLLMGQ